MQHIAKVFDGVVRGPLLRLRARRGRERVEIIMTRWSILFALGMSLLVTASASAQYSTIGNRFNNTSNSFYENIGVGFGFSIPGGANTVGIGPNGQRTPGGAIRFQQNNVLGAQPQFGNFAPGANGQAGFAVRGGDAGFNLGLTFGQGSSSSITSQSPSVTVPNGGTGFVSDTTMQPFVIGVIPVVGGGGAPLIGGGLMDSGMNYGFGGVPGFMRNQFPVAGPSRVGAALSGSLGPIDLTGKSSPKKEKKAAPPVPADPVRRELSRASSSSAGRPAASLDAIRRHQQATDTAKSSEALVYLKRGEDAEAAGKPSVAKIYYRMGLKRATGEVKTQLQAKLDGLLVSPGAR